MSQPPRPVRPLPGSPAGGTDEGIRTGLVTRIILATTVILGQLWAVTVGLEAYLLGHVGQAWGLAAFSLVSFLLVVALVRIGPSRRGTSGRSGRR